MPRGIPANGKCVDKEYVCRFCKGKYLAPGHSRRNWCSVCVPPGWTRASKHRVSKPHFDSMLHIQDHKCALCFCPLTSTHNICIDHDHLTMRIRGLLCKPCNTYMAAIDNRDWTIRAIAYRDRT